ncbi:Holliday junction resolvase RuvX [Candidatus Erwinia haradaeae]|uniref:Putative pre-16S rRNA nuclease n=1 Tax=Candidatus Erwinia haradaeae TaxID=1922217 RepID=A0A451D9L7_9GAMM|nr:Holliday junction resolvase RuvX [Candidatus Erwinia haradaeae]VFP82981.1 Putative pre-16S rRNA nuclease [Candidatus Erwinia haradaeae]
MKRRNTFLSFDFGMKSIGVASGQRVTSTAYPLKALKAQAGMPYLDKIDALIQEWQPTNIVVGLPLNMNGSEQPLTTRARTFASFMHMRYKILVNLHDERLSTVEARAVIFQRRGFQALRKDHVDSLSAAIILESWLQSTNFQHM